MFKSVWNWLNGKKTLVGASITLVAGLVSIIPPVLVAVGVEADQVAAGVGVAVTVVGLLHKLYKAIYREELP